MRETRKAGIDRPVLQRDALFQPPGRGREQAQIRNGDHKLGDNPELQQSQRKNRGLHQAENRCTLAQQEVAGEGQDDQGQQQIRHKSVPGRLVELPPLSFLQLRVGVELRGVRIPGREDEHGTVDLVHAVPAELLIKLQHGLGQLVVQNSAVGLQAVAHLARLATLKGAEQGAKFL